MKRYLVLAALAVATFVGGARSASADFSIQINGLDLVDGSATSDPLDFLSIDGTVVTDPTATAVNLKPGGGVHTLELYSGGSLVASFDFPTITDAVDSSSSAVGGVTTIFTINGSPVAGGTAVMSITIPNTSLSPVYTGQFGGSIEIFSAVPEPTSMAMLAMGGMGVLGAARRRRKV